MTERDQAAQRARILSAAKPGSTRMEVDDVGRSRLLRGKSSATIRAKVGALPIKSGALHHVIAVGAFEAPGDDRQGAFREVQRVLRDEGNFVYGKADTDGTFARDHLALREMGMVPAPMDTIPELSHVPWRLLAAFKPLTKSQASAERGHETH